jgi:hypothetical protein
MIETTSFGGEELHFSVNRVQRPYCGNKDLYVRENDDAWDHGWVDDQKYIPYDSTMDTQTGDFKCPSCKTCFRVELFSTDRLDMSNEDFLKHE